VLNNCIFDMFIDHTYYIGFIKVSVCWSTIITVVLFYRISNFTYSFLENDFRGLLLQLYYFYVKVTCQKYFRVTIFQ